MALVANVLTTFRRGDKTPEFVLWEGNVVVNNDAKKTDNGYDEMVFMGQMSLVKGRDGSEPYLSFPPIRAAGGGVKRGANGRAYTYYKVGPSLARIIIPAIEAALESEAVATGDLTAAAQDSFEDLGF